MPELLFERAFHPRLPPQTPPAVSSVWKKQSRGSPEHKARSVLIHNMLENSLQELGDSCNDFSIVSQKHRELQVTVCSPSSLKLSFSTNTGICGLLCQFLQSKEYHFHKLTDLIYNSIKMLRFSPKIKIGTLFFPLISQITAAAILIAVTS